MLFGILSLWPISLSFQNSWPMNARLPRQTVVASSGLEAPICLLMITVYNSMSFVIGVTVSDCSVWENVACVNRKWVSKSFSNIINFPFFVCYRLTVPCRSIVLYSFMWIHVCVRMCYVCMYRCRARLIVWADRVYNILPPLRGYADQQSDLKYRMNDIWV